MKLLHVTTVPQTLLFLVPHFRVLRARGVTVGAIAAPGDILDRLAAGEHVHIHPVPMTRQITPIADLIALVRLMVVFRRVRPDIVHAHTPKGGLLAMLAARLMGVPVCIYHIHGLPLETATGWRRWLLACTERVACLCAHQILCVSDSVRDVVVREKLVHPARIKVLLSGSISGIDALSRFCPELVSPDERSNVRRQWGIGPTDPVIGFVGRLVRDKGVLQLAESWRTLRAEIQQLHLLIVGDAESHDPEVAAVLKQLREDDRVHFVGVDWNTPRLFAAMDVIAFPTYREGLPYVPLEAGAMRLPVVASRVTGCVDAIVDGVTGTLIRPANSEELTASLRTYLQEPALRAQHGSAARKRVLESFDPETICEATFAEYQRLLAKTGHTSPGLPWDPTGTAARERGLEMPPEKMRGAA